MYQHFMRTLKNDRNPFVNNADKKNSPNILHAHFWVTCWLSHRLAWSSWGSSGSNESQTPQSSAHEKPQETKGQLGYSRSPRCFNMSNPLISSLAKSLMTSWSWDGHVLQKQQQWLFDCFWVWICSHFLKVIWSITWSLTSLCGWFITASTVANADSYFYSQHNFTGKGKWAYLLYSCT